MSETKKEPEEEIRTLFLEHPDNPNEPFAVFIDTREKNNLYLSYAHVGQHSQCSLGYINECKESDSYQDLLKELTDLVGYKILVMNASYHIFIVEDFSTNEKKEIPMRLSCKVDPDGNELSGDIVTKEEVVKFNDSVGKFVNIPVEVDAAARCCNETGELMHDGYCWGDEVYYTKDKETTIKEFRDDIACGSYDFDDVGPLVLLAKTDKELLQYGYDEEVFYYTEWYETFEEGYFYIKFNNQNYRVTNETEPKNSLAQALKSQSL